MSEIDLPECIKGKEIVLKSLNTQQKVSPADQDVSRQRQSIVAALETDESRIKRFIRISLSNLKIFHSNEELEERTEEVFQQTAARALEKSFDFDENRSAFNWINGFAANLIKQMQSRLLNERTKFED